MIANHIHHALAQVRELRQRILEKQRFKGYSGRARALGGCMALAAAIIMNLPSFPKTSFAHVVGWGVVFVLALLLNYSALVYWFLADPEVQRDWRKLKPALEILPPLFVDAAFTFVLIRHDWHDYLFGMWMCLFGLANIATRHMVPITIGWVGVFYIAAGTLLLLIPPSFLNSWPMGIVFFAGEWMGGFILHFDGVMPSSWLTFFGKETNDEP